MKSFSPIVDDNDIVTKKYIDGKVKTNVPENAVFTDTVYTHPATHDLAMLTDLSSDNVFSSNHKMNGLIYFKNNNVTDISQVYKTGFYGTKNTDTTTPYAGYWFVAVFCKDEVNQIAIQWAMPVSKAGNGELWMRTVRLNAASTSDGNMVGTWQRILNKTLADTLYATKTYVDGLIAEIEAKIGYMAISPQQISATQPSGQAVNDVWLEELS